MIISDEIMLFVLVGNSTRLTAKSPAAAMEWVVAIKEAIREDEERARKEVSVC